MHPTCTVITAQKDEELIGVVRICPENGVLMLRGMEIKPEFQRQGIGSRMLGEVEKILQGKECFGIPYEHLERFYGQIGFQKIDDKEAPSFLQNRITKYRQEYPDTRFILMKKSA